MSMCDKCCFSAHCLVSVPNLVVTGEYDPVLAAKLLLQELI